MAHHVLARKWRPHNFHEVVGQQHVVTALTNGLDHDRLHHAFLFTGTRGVGKTTLARILAKSLNCEKGVSSTPCGVCSICAEVDSGRFVDLIEIDAASRTKVEDTREILDNVQYAPTRGRYKVYLIDEVHMLSNSSFNALLKTLEEPPAHVKFILATTDPQKLPVTVLSRCLRFHLKKMSIDEIKQQLVKILTAEAIPFDDEALTLIARAGTGSMRDALSLLDQAIAFTAANIGYKPVQEMLGIIDDQYTLALLEALATESAPELLKTTKKLAEFGLDYHGLLEALIDSFHQLTLLQIDPQFVAFEQTEVDRWQDLAARISAENLQLYYQIALHGRRDLNLHPSAELGFEMTLLRMLLFVPEGSALPEKAPAPHTLEAKKNLTTEASQVSSLSAIRSNLAAGQHTVAPAITPRSIEKIAAVVPEDGAAPTMHSAVEDKPQTIDKAHIPQPPAAIEAVVAEASVHLPNIVDHQQRKPSADSQHLSQIVQALEDELPPWLDAVNESPLTDAYGAAFSASIPPSIPEHFSDDSAGTAYVANHNTAIPPRLDHGMPLTMPAPIAVDAFEVPLIPSEEGRKHEVGIASETEPDLVTLITEAPVAINETAPESVVVVPALTNNEAWLTIVGLLSLEGITKAIARNLVFKSLSNNHLILLRSEEERAFHVADAEQSISTAVSQILGENIVCSIELVNEALGEENFDQRADKEYQERLRAATQKLYAEPVVRTLMDACGATLLEETINIT